jgi:hypothetical protein
MIGAIPAPRVAIELRLWLSGLPFFRVRDLEDLLTRPRMARSVFLLLGLATLERDVHHAPLTETLSLWLLPSAGVEVIPSPCGAVFAPTPRLQGRNV